jgi:hypothetical protein
VSLRSAERKDRSVGRAFANPQFGLLKAASRGQLLRMPESVPPLIQFLLISAVVLLGLLVVTSWRVAGRLARIERRLAEPSNRGESESSPPDHEEAATGGAFESFLSEDPSRRSLPKAEQSAAYRKWRQEKGLNWAGSGDR